MSKLILITGGAGFIGTHLADELLRRGHRVRALDALVAQVHGEDCLRPAGLDPEVELRVGDVLDPRAVDEALEGVDAVCHLAAMVGVGQSMHRVADYAAVNTEGTAVLMEALARRPAGRLVVASSMHVYGEGLYRSRSGLAVTGARRAAERLKAGRWEPADENGHPLSPVPTPETKPADCASVYSLTKYDQERLGLLLGPACGMPVVALRLFNVYGPRQPLSNPYSGALALFASRLLNGLRPLLFEDGLQSRDFVHVRDTARAFADALDAPRAPGLAINIGSGQPRTLREIASRLAAATGRPHLLPEATQRHRPGDVRHCFADISLAREILGFRPKIDLDAGLADLARWLEDRLAGDLRTTARAAASAGPAW